MQTVEDTLSKKGGRLDPKAIHGTAGQLLEQSTEIFRAYLRPLIALDPTSPVTRTTPPSRVSQFEFVTKWDVNAWAVLAEERPLVLFHAGIPFALFELFHSLLAQRTVLPDLGIDGNSTPSPFPRRPRILPTLPGVNGRIWSHSLPTNVKDCEGQDLKARKPQ